MIELLLVLAGTVLGVSGTLGVQYAIRYRILTSNPSKRYQVVLDGGVLFDTDDLGKAKRHRRVLRSIRQNVGLVVDGEFRN